MKNKLLKQVWLLCLLLFGGFVSAQTVTGTVSEANGPLPGVNIIEKGTSNGTQTDFDGNYSLDLSSSNATLVFSYLGYTTQEVAVNGQTSINITLQEDAAQYNKKRNYFGCNQSR